MKLLRQVTLHFISGTSRKAYEVDLCEVGEGRYVVNFRYGRIGSALRDGSKTAAPVTQAEAERVFDKLVEEKKAKGYREVGARDAHDDTPAAPPPAPTSAALAKRKRAVLEQLHAAAKDERGRSLSRLVWRAGELRLVEAGPLLLELLETSTKKADAPPKERPWLRIVKGARAREEDPQNLAVVESWIPMDAVGTLRTKGGELLRFGASACRDVVPAVGVRVLYDDVEPHPLGGLRARSVRLPPAEAARLREEQRRQQQEADQAARHPRKDLVEDRRAVLRYALVWSLGRVRHEPATQALASLFFDAALAERERSPAQRAAGEALRALVQGDAKERFETRVLEELPEPLRVAIDSGAAERVARALEQHLAEGSPAAFASLDRLYLLDDDAVRAALLDWVRETPLKPPAFQRFRHLFKAAEQRGDWEMFGLCAWRLEKTPAMVTGSYYAYVDGKWTNLRMEAMKPDAGVAYSGVTRRYLRHRVWRTLRRLGEVGDSEYAKAAAGVLLPFSDDDAQSVRESSLAVFEPQSYRVSHYLTSKFDRFAPYWAFNHVLYRHSPRYFLKAGGRAFRCREPYQPGDAAPDVREEAFPALWDAEPVALLHVCVESRCQPVLEHAVRALKQNQTFTGELPVEALAALLARPYPLVSRFALALAESRYDENAPDLEVVLAVLASPLDEARVQGRSWIERDRARFARDAAFLVRLALAPFADARALARELLLLADAGAAQEITTRLLAALLSLDAEPQGAIAKDAGDALLHAFPDALRELGLDVVRDLLAHPLEEVQAFGARILLGHRVGPAALPKDLIPALVTARFASVRSVGIRLFGALPEEQLPERLGLFRDLCTSPLADVRAAVRPVLARLAPAHEAFVADLSTLLVPHLLRKERAEGLHRDLASLLLEDLPRGLSWAKVELVLKLLRSRYPAAQQVGAKLLAENLHADDVSVVQLTELLSHDVLAVRESARRMLESSLPRLKASMSDAVRALDASWDDSRVWAFRFFEERMGEEDFTPAILVGICDSVRDDVQHFGMKLTSRYFKEPYGPEYLLKLSEHPSANLQLHATNYLERFATGDAERLAALAPFFLAVLSRVNKGRVAKQRVLAFLDEEARRDEASARVVAELLTRQSVTIAIGDKARCIETLASIQRRWPSVSVPLVVKAPPLREVRHGV